VSEDLEPTEQPDRDSDASEPLPPAGSPGQLQPIERSFEAAVSFSGPLPPPATLKAYGEVRSDYPERIMAMAEKEAAHRQEIAVRVQAASERRGATGLWTGAFIAVLGLVIAGLLINDGHEAAGVILGSFDLVGLVAVFVLGRRNGR